MAVADPLETPVPYQCQNHQKCRRRMYQNETFNTLKILGTRMISPSGEKLREWIILTCPHCKDTFTIHLTPELYSICPFVEVKVPMYGC